MRCACGAAATLKSDCCGDPVCNVHHVKDDDDIYCKSCLEWERDAYNRHSKGTPMPDRLKMA